MLEELSLAADLVRSAGDLAAGMRRQAGLRVERKTSVTDVVSAADRAAEELVAQRIERAYPDDAIVGEEGASRAGTGDMPRTWYVDPVDGTYNFVSGLPAWCSAIALDDDMGEGLLGAIYQPSAQEMWLGSPDHPATCNDEPVTPLIDRPLSQLSVASYFHPTSLADEGFMRPLTRVLARAATVRMLGSGSVELAAVASGRLGLYVQVDCLPWDWLPGAALVAAAGGTAQMVEMAGRRWHVAGNVEAVSEALSLLAI